MNKAQLISMVSRKSGVNSDQVEQGVNFIFNWVARVLKENGRIEFRDFGTFENRDHKGYIGKNPKTGRKILVGPRKRPCFKPGKAFQKLINETHVKNDELMQE